MPPGQSQIYANTANAFAADALKGLSSTMLFCGAAHEEKVFTMLGTEQEPGIMPRVALALFQGLATDPKAATTTIAASFCSVRARGVVCAV